MQSFQVSGLTQHKTTPKLCPVMFLKQAWQYSSRSEVLVSYKVACLLMPECQFSTYLWWSFSNSDNRKRSLLDIHIYIIYIFPCEHVCVYRFFLCWLHVLTFLEITCLYSSAWNTVCSSLCGSTAAEYRRNAPLTINCPCTNQSFIAFSHL